MRYYRPRVRYMGPAAGCLTVLGIYTVSAIVVALSLKGARR